ncbi:hypothetical protein HID58_051691, partial [Brassica napus]
ARVKEAGHVFRSPPSRPSRLDLTITAFRAAPPKPSFHRSSYYRRTSIESSSRSHPKPPKHPPHRVETHKPSLFIHALLKHLKPATQDYESLHPRSQNPATAELKKPPPPKTRAQTKRSGKGGEGEAVEVHLNGRTEGSGDGKLAHAPTVRRTKR